MNGNGENNLSNSNTTSNEKIIAPPDDASWLDKCPVCKSGKLLPVTKKKLFGFVKTKNFECNTCNAIFTQKGEKYQLTQIFPELSVKK